MARSVLIALVLILAVSADASAHRVYVALGDSVAAPPGSYADRYFTYLRDGAHGGVDRLAKLAVGGATSTGMLVPRGQLDQAVAVIRRRSDTKVVTLDIGGNDALNGACLPPNSAGCPFPENYRRIVGTLADALGDDPGRETFQVMQYYNPQSGTGSPLEAVYDAGLLGADGKIDCTRSGADLGLNDLIACIGDDAGAEPVDVYPTAKAVGPPFMGDAIHPSRAGQAAIACLFAHPDRVGVGAPCRVLSLSGRRRQRGRALTVSVRTELPSTATISARVKLPGRDLRLAQVVQTLAGATRVAIRLAVPTRVPGRVDVVVKVRAVDATGRSFSESRTFKLVR